MLETTRGGPLDTRFREYDKFRGCIAPETCQATSRCASRSAGRDGRRDSKALGSGRGLHVNYYVSYSRKRVSSVPRRSALGFVISMSAAIGMSEADHQPRRPGLVDRFAIGEYPECHDATSTESRS